MESFCLILPWCKPLVRGTRVNSEIFRVKASRNLFIGMYGGKERSEYN